MRIVFDANVFIAAALKSGLARQIQGLAVKGKITLITSSDILQEVSDKLSEKFSWDNIPLALYLDSAREVSEIVEPTIRVREVIRDPDDDKVLAAAVVGKADIIVTSDKHLLKLKKYRGIAIVHPKTLSYMFPFDLKG